MCSFFATLPNCEYSLNLNPLKILKLLEDMEVLRRSLELLNIVEIGQGQLQLIVKQILFYHIWGLQPFGQVT